MTARMDLTSLYVLFHVAIMKIELVINGMTVCLSGSKDSTQQFYLQSYNISFTRE